MELSELFVWNSFRGLTVLTFIGMGSEAHVAGPEEFQKPAKGSLAYKFSTIFAFSTMFLKLFHTAWSPLMFGGLRKL